MRTLLPVVDRLRSRFALEALCIVADRGMISTETVAELLGRGPEVPLHPSRQCDQIVLPDPARFQEVRGPGRRIKDPGPLEVKGGQGRRPALQIHLT